MFLYYIPPPNKWQPHKAVKDSLGTPDNKIQIFCEKCSWLEIYRNFGTCSVVSLVFFCPDHYGRRPKSRVLISEKIWGSMKYFSMSNILDIEKYICVNTALSGKGIKEFESSIYPSIQSVWLQSNVVFAVRDQNPAHIFRRLSPNILQWLSRGSRKIQWEGKRNKHKISFLNPLDIALIMTWHTYMDGKLWLHL